MSRGLEVAPHEAQEFKSVSAPSSADFYIAEEILRAKPRYQRRPFLDPPVYFPRDHNDLVDFDTYLDYFVDEPDDVPIEISGTEKAIWLYHHPYFQRDFYQQPGIPKFIKDTDLAEFGNSPYNQLAMRRLQEIKAHKRHEEQVSPPPPETMKRALTDHKYLDILGAAAVGRRIALIPEALDHLVPGATLNKQIRDYSPLQKARFFDQEMAKALRILDKPLVTPQRVITGAIRRMGRRFNNQILIEAAAERIDEDPIYYPVRLRSTGQLYSLSQKLLRNICLVENIDEEGETTLRTGVNEVQLAA